MSHATIPTSLDKDELRRRYTLLKNIISRMSLNERQGIWTLPGNITKEERKALFTGLDVLSTIIQVEWEE